MAFGARPSDQTQPAKQLPVDSTEKIRESLFAGRQVNAIDTYRQIVASGRRRAALAVGEYQQALFDEHPEKFHLCGSAMKFRDMSF